MRPSRGFTLLELVVTVAIVAVLAAAGVPSLLTWLGNTRVRASAESMANGLRLAQAEAVRRNANVTFKLVADPATPTAVRTGVNWVMVDNAGTLIQAKAAEQAIRVVQAPLPNTFTGTIVFNGMGQTNLTATQALVFSATNGDHPLRVLVSTAGRVRLCDPARAAGDPQACESS